MPCPSFGRCPTRTLSSRLQRSISAPSSIIRIDQRSAVILSRPKEGEGISTSTQPDHRNHDAQINGEHHYSNRSKRRCHPEPSEGGRRISTSTQPDHRNHDAQINGELYDSNRSKKRCHPEPTEGGRSISTST